MTKYQLKQDITNLKLYLATDGLQIYENNVSKEIMDEYNRFVFDVVSQEIPILRFAKYCFLYILDNKKDQCRFEIFYKSSKRKGTLPVPLWLTSKMLNYHHKTGQYFVDKSHFMKRKGECDYYDYDSILTPDITFQLVYFASVGPMIRNFTYHIFPPQKNDIEFMH